jgi:hypothetical protein
MEAYVAQEALQLHEAQAGKNDIQIGILPFLRPDNSLGGFTMMLPWVASHRFDLENEYVVAVMTKHVRAH